MENQINQNQDSRIEEIVEKRVEKKIMIYRFMLFAALSILFILTFVYYLPLRFEHTSQKHVAPVGDEEGVGPDEHQ